MVNKSFFKSHKSQIRVDRCLNLWQLFHKCCFRENTYQNLQGKIIKLYANILLVLFQLIPNITL